MVPHNGFSGSALLHVENLLLSAGFAGGTWEAHAYGVPTAGVGLKVD